MKKPKNKIVITGGYGFIGSRFVKWVYENTSYDILVIDKMTYAGDYSRISDEIKEDQNRFRFLQKDICDVTQNDLLFTKYIVNFAAESHVDNSIADGKPFIRSNIEGVFNLLEAVREVPELEKFIQISTDEVYGDMRDYRKGNRDADETYPLRPSSYYSASKASADLLVMSCARTFGINYLITRTCNNFGEGQNPEKFLPKLFTKIAENEPVPVYGDGGQIREWIHNDDNCAMIGYLMLSSARNEVYNIGSGYHYKNIDIVKYVAKTLLRDVDYKYVDDRLGHDRMYSLNSGKVEDFLGERVYLSLEGFLKDEVGKYEDSLDGE
tara:strand:- start:1388 stop:2359 length:972 start_codon:yes stop_codon:yes gene_type:complete